MTEIEKYADKAMYPAAPMKSITPKVHLLWMTPDPLGAIAAACRMYKGIPTYNLNDITNEERKDYWEQVQKTHLKAPLEFVKLHFFIEGVTRSFTHQMVRQRTAVYAQESLRFSVKEDLREEIPYPPSLNDSTLSPSARNDLRKVWDEAIGQVDYAYRNLIANGVPAEDARGLLPHQTTTRLNYATDLRGLLDHAGNRLCTQAQFEWRAVFIGIMDAIKNKEVNEMMAKGADLESLGGDLEGHPTHWQFEHIVNSGVFAPICYEQGRCPFNADFDRGCTIRGRVEEFHLKGVPSKLWDSESVYPESRISRDEWLTDPKAGWVE